MKSEELINRIEQEFASSIKDKKIDVSQPFIEIDHSSLHTVLKRLKEDDEFSFNYLRCLSGVDAEDHFKVVYHLYSYRNDHEIVIKVRTGKEEPKIDSASDIWSVADWHEREAFDLFGIRFNNHPDLRRILLPEDWVGHPLRKDYKEPESYRGIPATRKKEKR